jgi:hypothetical protein
VAIIAHGSSSGHAIRNAVRAAANEALVRHVNSEIVDGLTAIPPNLMAKPVSARGIRGVLERMRERLHSGRDTHSLKRPEVSSEAAGQREGIQTRGESMLPVAVTAKTGPINPDRVRVEPTNSHKSSAEKTGLTNGLRITEPDRGENEVQADNNVQPVKPV